MQIRLKNPVELKPFSILQSVSQNRRDKRESVSARETNEGQWQSEEEILRFSQQVRLHCKRLTAGNRGALMVVDNCLITHTVDTLQPNTSS